MSSDTAAQLNRAIAEKRGCTYDGKPVCPFDDCPGYMHLPPIYEHGMIKANQPILLPDFLTGAWTATLLEELADDGWYLHMNREMAVPNGIYGINGQAFLPERAFSVLSVHYGHAVGAAWLAAQGEK